MPVAATVMKDRRRGAFRLLQIARPLDLPVETGELGFQSFVLVVLGVGIVALLGFGLVVDRPHFGDGERSPLLQFMQLWP